MAQSEVATFEGRRAIADRVFRGALYINLALTLFCAVAYFTDAGDEIAGTRRFDTQALGRVLFGVATGNALICLGFGTWVLA